VHGGLAGLGILGVLFALGVLAQSVRARRWGAAVASLWLLEAALLHGVITTVGIATAIRSSPKPLVERLLADLPAVASLTVSGLGDDSSLLVLLYFPDPERITVVPSAQGLPRSFAPGYYLFSRQRWWRITSSQAGMLGTWRVLWVDELGERKHPAPVVFVEHS
jgi:hypothetical protein